MLVYRMSLFYYRVISISNTGIQTTQDARFYGITSKLETPFSNVGKDLVLQFAVRHPQKIDCGGGYIKLLPADVDQVNCVSCWLYCYIDTQL